MNRMIEACILSGMPRRTSHRCNLEGYVDHSQAIASISSNRYATLDLLFILSSAHSEEQRRKSRNSVTSSLNRGELDTRLCIYIPFQNQPSWCFHRGIAFVLHGIAVLSHMRNAWQYFEQYEVDCNIRSM